MDEDIMVRVEWDDTECDCEGPLPPSEVAVPRSVYEDGMTSWDEPVANYLSDKYGFLVRDWKPVEVV